jgi:hypothetical protein
LLQIYVATNYFRRVAIPQAKGDYEIILDGWICRKNDSKGFAVKSHFEEVDIDGRYRNDDLNVRN